MAKDKIKRSFMKLRYITCSDIRENVPAEKAVDLLKGSKKVELGIQAHSPCMCTGMPRNLWLNRLLNISDACHTPLNIAIHINYNWCSDFCLGNTPEEINNLLQRKHKSTGMPMIKRWQLNLGDGTIIPNPDQISKIIKSFPYQEFIFPYNSNHDLQDFIKELNKTGAKFSLLFDASYGAGISPTSWDEPVYKTHSQGYAGGLSPENVTENLNKIAKVAGDRDDIWIDAEGRLMKPGTRIFDLDKAVKYITNALNWEQRQK